MIRGPNSEWGSSLYDNLISNNISGCTDFKTDVFTAPKASFYTFSFSISKTAYKFDLMDIHLRMNGVRIGKAGAGYGLYICEHGSHAVHLPIKEEGSN